MPYKLDPKLVEKVRKIRAKYTANVISKKLGLSLNTINAMTSNYKLLSSEDRRILWRKYATPIANKAKREKVIEKIKNIQLDKNLGYILGCMYGDAWIRQHGSSKSIALSTRNESFARYFSSVLKTVTGRESRFYENTYDKITPDNNMYSNTKFYEVSLNSRDFVDFLIRKFDLKKPKLDKIISQKDILKYGNKFSIGFLQGIFDSDGGIYIVERKDRIKPRISIVLYSSSKRMLNVIHNLLRGLGFWPTKVLTYRNNSSFEAYRLIIYRVQDITKFYNLVGFRVDYKNERLENAVKLSSKYSFHFSK